jgi:hypothetical protein
MMSIRFRSDAVAKIRADCNRGEHQREHSHANGEKYASRRHEDPPLRSHRGALIHRVNVLA